MDIPIGLMKVVIYTGDEFVGVITEAIQNSEIFLFVSSANSNKSDWTNHEIAVAKLLKKKTIPFKVDNAIYNTSILMYLAPLDFIDYPKNPAKAFDALIASLKNHYAKLDKLGLSSRIHLNDERGDYISKFGIKHFTIESKLRKENDEREHQIFISYKRDDSDMVFPIKDKIELNTDIKCWIDLDGIESDAQFVNVIIKAINKADVFLFMYSHSHAEIEDYEKDWTVREISFAQKKNKRIVFVNIDNTPLTDWFEMMFGLQQQVNATSNSAMKRLYRDLKKWLG